MGENKDNYLEKIKICDLSFAAGCNFKCKMCYNWKTKNISPEVMSIEQWQKFLKHLEQTFDEDLHVIFSGPGEVLLREGAEELLHAANNKFKVSLNSNGFLINEYMAAVIAETVHCLVLSLDGVFPATHDYLRGMPGSHERVMSAIKFLREKSSQIKIIINTVILEQNLDELIRLVQWVDKMDVSGIMFQAVAMPSNITQDKYWYKHDFENLWPKSEKKVKNVISELVGLKQNGSRINNSVNHLKSFEDYFLYPERRVENIKCEVDRVLKVDSCGNVRICEFDTDPVGNVKTDSIEKIWNAEAAFMQRKKAYGCRENCHLLINCFHE